MLVLGIETSCDETAAAIVEGHSNSYRILSETLASQAKVHEAYGGVVPEYAAREHLSQLPLIVDQALREAGTSYRDLSAIGVTRGPGLKGCLLTGLTFAKALSWASGLPLLGVNHIEGHLHVARLDNTELEYPFLALVVSGGHTEIVEVHDVGRYKIIARTSDDAAGEAFDKSANLIGFTYPGGAALAQLADSYGKTHFKLPRVMREAPGFSFSGLKTAIALLVKREKEALQDPNIRGALAYAIQESIVDALCFKLELAIKTSRIKQVVVTGGVSANKFLRARVQALPGVRVFFPQFSHSVDNGAMIAYLAALRHARGERSALNIEPLSRWPVEEVL